MAEAKSLRCTPCGRNYPADDDYRICPRCEDETWESSKAPMPAAEARSIKLHADFERLYGPAEVS